MGCLWTIPVLVFWGCRNELPQIAQLLSVEIDSPWLWGQKSEIKVSAGLCSLRRLQASILPHLSQPLVSRGLLSLWPGPSSVSLLWSQISLPLRLLSPLLSLRRIVSFIMVSPSFLFFPPIFLACRILVH